MWQTRLERAEQAYNSYLESTRYPFNSQPIDQHRDQAYPFAPIEEVQSLDGDSGSKGVQLLTTQERVFLSGQESVKFTVAAVDSAGRALPMTIRSAGARSVDDQKNTAPPIHADLAFTDNGVDADEAARDGRYSARLLPATQGFANHNGTIRILADVAVNGKPSVVHFEVIYTPLVPATWGTVREALEHGSLNFYLEAHVLRAGRYVVSGRVDDANGKPLALVQFNDEVAAGQRQFKLNVFGALIYDNRPTFPLKLRDVEGFLLIPDQFPDRAMLPRHAGIVHTSKVYPIDRFSHADWTSEERQRYLDEYAKDVDTAREQISELTR